MKALPLYTKIKIDKDIDIRVTLGQCFVTPQGKSLVIVVEGSLVGGRIIGWKEIYLCSHDVFFLKIIIPAISSLFTID